MQIDGRITADFGKKNRGNPGIYFGGQKKHDFFNLLLRESTCQITTAHPLSAWIPTFRSGEGRRLVLSSFFVSVVKEHVSDEQSKATGSTIRRRGQIPGLSCGTAAACTTVVLRV